MSESIYGPFRDGESGLDFGSPDLLYPAVVKNPGLMLGCGLGWRESNGY